MGRCSLEIVPICGQNRVCFAYWETSHEKLLQDYDWEPLFNLQKTHPHKISLSNSLWWSWTSCAARIYFPPLQPNSCKINQLPTVIPNICHVDWLGSTAQFNIRGAQTPLHDWLLAQSHILLWNEFISFWIGWLCSAVLGVCAIFSEASVDQRVVKAWWCHLKLSPG